MEIKELMEKDKQYVLNTYARFDLGLEKGKGATCYDFDGKEYIDFSSGIGVNSLGFANPQWVQAIASQAATLQHTSNLFYTEPCVKAAEILCRRTGMDKVFFSNSGAEANEAAIKCARKYSYLKYGEDRHTIVTLTNSFHGRTVTTLAATGQEVFHQNFFPFTDGFVHAIAGDLEDTLSKLDNKACAVMFELIQGEGGIVPLEESYVKAVVDYCKEHDILVLIDEVQTGVGRTGSLYCFLQYGIKPDVVSSAKGIGGGLPLGVTLYSEKAAACMIAGDHATTYGGNPICCAGALEVLGQMDDTFLKEVTEKGEYIREALLGLPKVEGIYGKGLMLGVQLRDIEAKEVVNQCLKNGLIPLTAKERIRLLPPLNITYEELDKGIAILKKILG